MSDPLYKKELLRLAANATGSGRLAVPCSTGTAHNPACGDKVTMDVALQDGRVAALAHDTKACVITQAASAILGSGAVGMRREEVARLHVAVAAMLNGGAVPGAPFDAFGVFDGVAGHGARHRCVLLPIEAVVAALESSDGGEPRG